MATKPKRTTAGGRGKAPRDDLERRAAEAEEAFAANLPAKVARALKRQATPRRELVAPVKESLDRVAALEAPPPGRHDEKRPPAGHRVATEDGRKKLYPATEEAQIFPSSARIALTLRVPVDKYPDILGFNPTPPNEHERLQLRYLANFAAQLEKNASWPAEWHAQLKRAHQAVFHPAFAEQWQHALAKHIRAALFTEKECEINGQRPRDPDDAARDAHMWLCSLAKLSGMAIPPELTVEVVKLALTECNLGGKGGKGKRGGTTPEKWVERFAKTIAVTRSK